MNTNTWRSDRPADGGAQPRVVGPARAQTAARGQVLSGRDVVVAAVICLVMCVTFWLVSTGAELRVTFVPGALVSLGVISHMFLRRTPLPLPERVLPMYMVALAWQGVHFAEEHATGFWRDFPTLYGGHPVTVDFFTWFNMLAYAIFSLATLAALIGNLGPLLLPSMFFAVYGGIANAISHVTWSVMTGGYFPGLFTGSVYLVIGPLLLRRLWPGSSWRHLAVVVTAFLVTMVPLEVVLATR